MHNRRKYRSYLPWFGLSEHIVKGPIEAIDALMIEYRKGNLFLQEYEYLDCKVDSGVRSCPYSDSDPRGLYYLMCVLKPDVITSINSLR